jgi:hypothetical protein
MKLLGFTFAMVVFPIGTYFLIISFMPKCMHPLLFILAHLAFVNLTAISTLRSPIMPTSLAKETAWRSIILAPDGHSFPELPGLQI